ncbi:MAG: hypothetical protein WBJ75_09100 [Pseudohongiellaceae bacterium]|nr:MAG: hypothetical protein A3H44_15325 [Gammaproteobacteria bacterium RIFCSPLOWO2_02_FULL_57_10]
MKKTIMTASALALACFTTIISSQDNSMSFFITSVGSGDGANLGGLEGADAHCAALATAVGAGGKTWRAYLSTQGAGGVNARDRIGTGPWYNARGVMIAENVAQLHSEEAMTGKENSLTEAGNMVNGRGDTPNQHDILTGSQADGTAFSGDTNLTCNNWTSNSAGSAQAGHHDRQGGGANPTSWNSAHGTRSCSQEDLIATGGNGYFYCFAID